MTKKLIVTIDSGAERYEDSYSADCDIDLHYSTGRWIAIRKLGEFPAGIYNPTFVVSLTFEDREDD